MRLERILSLLYASPWAILPANHAAIRAALAKHLDRTAFADLTGPENRDGFEVVGTTAIVPIEGVILNKCSGMELMCGGFSLANFRQTLKELGAREDVKSVVFNIASGGGTVTGVPEAAQSIKALSATKSVVAYTDDVCASAAYWLACNASRFYISQSAQAGSIGVYCAFLDQSEAFKQEGVSVELFKGGNSAFKAMGYDGTSLTDEQRAYLQESVDKTYAEFTSLVKRNRSKVSEDALTGKMFDGLEAVAVGLADGVVNDLDALVDYLNG